MGTRLPSSMQSGTCGNTPSIASTSESVSLTRRGINTRDRVEEPAARVSGSCRHPRSAAKRTCRSPAAWQTGTGRCHRNTKSSNNRLACYETKQMSREWIGRQHLLHLRGQAVKAVTHADRAAGQIDPGAWHYLDHDVARNTASTRRSARSLTKASTRKRTPSADRSRSRQAAHPCPGAARSPAATMHRRPQSTRVRRSALVLLPLPGQQRQLE